MRNYLFAVDDKKYIVKAENENCAYDTLREYFDDIHSIYYLGWCTDEVAEELGYEVYKKPTPKGLTIKELYAWAQANGCEDLRFVYGDGNGTFWPCSRYPEAYMVSDTEISLFEY